MKIVGFYGDELIIKSDNSILEAFDSFYCEDDSENGELEANFCFAVKINHICKSVPDRLAGKFYEDVCFAMDFRKKNACAGALAYAFDYSFAVGKWVKRSEVDLNGVEFFKAGEKLDLTYSEEILNRLNVVIEKITQSMSLKVGDVVFVALEDCARGVKIGDSYSVVKNEDCILDCKVK